MKKYWTFLSVLICFIISSSCDRAGDFVIFSIEDDKTLGAQVAQEIESNPAEFPILDEAAFPFAYNYIRNLTQEIINSGNLNYREEFVWQVKIIHDDSTLNAFAAPGGYIYVYTGLIKYLDKEDDLAGVMGHEIAHADQRHSVKQLQRIYGIQILLSIVLGNDPGQLQQIAAALAGNLEMLRFSRSAEREADDYSVLYLAETPYQCNGAFSFFQKLIESEQAGRTPKFLSTHPNPEDRIDDINAKAEEIGCSTIPLDPPSYQDFKNSLPD
jgi:predicted Zn-dependent protease